MSSSNKEGSNSTTIRIPIRKRPVGRPSKKVIDKVTATPAEIKSAAPTAPPAATAQPQQQAADDLSAIDLISKYNWVNSCPDKTVIFKVEWFRGGNTTNAWRETYIADVRHVLAQFGADILADKVKVTMLPALKWSNEARMAYQNNVGFRKQVNNSISRRKQLQAAAHDKSKTPTASGPTAASAAPNAAPSSSSTSTAGPTSANVEASLDTAINYDAYIQKASSTVANAVMASANSQMPL